MKRSVVCAKPHIDKAEQLNVTIPSSSDSIRSEEGRSISIWIIVDDVNGLIQILSLHHTQNGTEDFLLKGRERSKINFYLDGLLTL